MDKKEKLKMKLIELAKSGNLDLEQFPESIRQKISQIRQNEGMILKFKSMISIDLISMPCPRPLIGRVFHKSTAPSVGNQCEIPH